DLLVAAIWPFVDTTKHTSWGSILAKSQGGWGQVFISFFGLVEWVCSWALWGIALKDGAKPVDHVWFFSQTLSMLSSVTAFLRLPVVYDLQPEVIIPAKYGIDVFGDMASGLWYF